MKNILPGGKAEKLKPKDFDPNELKLGIKVEMEHTKNKNLAKEIAMDHLAEFPNYYTNLLKMEKELETQKDKKENKAISPIKRNYDYGGNFLDKVERRQKRNSRRKDRISKLSSLDFKRIFTK